MTDPPVPPTTEPTASLGASADARATVKLNMADANFEELVIKKETVAVELCTVRGDLARGAVFLRPTDGAERGERLLDVLSQRWFVPLKTDDKLIFIATRHLAWARLDLLAAIDELDPEAEGDENSCVARVSVEMIDGKKIEGLLRYTLPGSARRLGDYLEKLESFFPLRTDDHVYLVASHCVAAVVPIEEKR
jgi:hypothetical protein